ncbi:MULTISPECIES: helix-turn-helix domain-containing protein [Aurantimonas]|jgi:DNA-binding transcriptional regulator YiaG|uniref:helix-turn-helix domain-containing protein n=1 Tax=Aurantimonas TaxID=182269 RepID=UPI003513A9DD
MVGKDIKLTGDQVKFIRNMLGESQAVFAARLAVSQPVVFRLERKQAEEITGPEIILISQIADENGIVVPDQPIRRDVTDEVAA